MNIKELALKNEVKLKAVIDEAFVLSVNDIEKHRQIINDKLAKEMISKARPSINETRDIATQTNIYQTDSFYVFNENDLISFVQSVIKQAKTEIQEALRITLGA